MFSPTQNPASDKFMSASGGTVKIITMRITGLTVLCSISIFLNLTRSKNVHVLTNTHNRTVVYVGTFRLIAGYASEPPFSSSVCSTFQTAARCLPSSACLASCEHKSATCGSRAAPTPVDNCLRHKKNYRLTILLPFLLRSSQNRSALLSSFERSATGKEPLGEPTPGGRMIQCTSYGTKQASNTNREAALQELPSFL
jgi:hypothetical protein